MLGNMPIKNKQDDRLRITMYVIIGIICALSIIITMAVQIWEMVTPKEKIEEKPPIDIKEFSTIFNNQLNTQNYAVNQIEKIDKDRDLVYTTYEYGEKVDGKYDIEVKLPSVNISDEISKEINKNISDIFKEKALSIMDNESEQHIIYTVDYTAYINSNILSLVIKSNLKEGQNAQRVIVKTYNYNMTSGEWIGFNEMLSIKQLNKDDVKKEINKVVKENAKQSESLKSLGYKIYERNLDDEMYNIENITNFFYGPDGVLYIIFAYGNNNFTAELDVATIE